MNERIKDFIGIFLFGLSILTIIEILFQIMINLCVFLFKAYIISLITNLNIFFTFEIFFVILSLLIGMAYVFWFLDYKKDKNGKQRKKRRY